MKALSTTKRSKPVRMSVRVPVATSITSRPPRPNSPSTTRRCPSGLTIPPLAGYSRTISRVPTSMTMVPAIEEASLATENCDPSAVHVSAASAVVSKRSNGSNVTASSNSTAH